MDQNVEDAVHAYQAACVRTSDAHDAWAKVRAIYEEAGRVVDGAEEAASKARAIMLQAIVGEAKRMMPDASPSGD